MPLIVPKTITKPTTNDHNSGVDKLLKKCYTIVIIYINKFLDDAEITTLWRINYEHI
ncbi:MAG: hypothetical protein J6A58_14775 [Oscillospiraceae bacterium]|nr:hypothetical protein [Oscillospiraceae bacterium]